MAGEFGGMAYWTGQNRLEALVAATRKLMRVQLCAIRLVPDDGYTEAPSRGSGEASVNAGEHATTAMVVTGPVYKIKMLEMHSAIVRDVNKAVFTGKEGDDVSWNWTDFHHAQEKPMRRVFDDVRRMRVYFGAKVSKRTAGANERRNHRTQGRAVKHKDKRWTKLWS